MKVPPALTEVPRPLILFDGVCNLCHWTVAFIRKNDPHHRFHIAPLQSALGVRVQSELNIDGRPGSTLVLVDRSSVHLRSGAVLRIFRRLRWPWPLMALFLIVPPPIRDAGYRLMARYRYRVFGKRALTDSEASRSDDRP